MHYTCFCNINEQLNMDANVTLNFKKNEKQSRVMKVIIFFIMKRTSLTCNILGNQLLTFQILCYFGDTLDVYGKGPIAFKLLNGIFKCVIDLLCPKGHKECVKSIS